MAFFPLKYLVVIFIVFAKYLTKFCSNDDVNIWSKNGEKKLRVEMKIGLLDKKETADGQKIGNWLQGEIFFFLAFDEKFVLMQKSQKQVDTSRRNSI